VVAAVPALRTAAAGGRFTSAPTTVRGPPQLISTRTPKRQVTSAYAAISDKLQRSRYAASVLRPHLRACVAAAALALGLSSCSSAALSALTAPSSSSAAVSGATSTAGTSSASSGHALLRVHDPRRVTGTIPAHCTFRDGGQLPDPKCTPGAVDPAVTQGNLRSTICHPGYTKTVRPSASQTDRFKFEVAYPAYGERHSKKTELDHLVSLELGGANDAANLWPESPPTPNPKDKVENALHAAICDGKITLKAAQNAIASNWETAERELGLS
jgi:hypothetical protein